MVNCAMSGDGSIECTWIMISLEYSIRSPLSKVKLRFISIEKKPPFYMQMKVIRRPSSHVGIDGNFFYRRVYHIVNGSITRCNILGIYNCVPFNRLLTVHVVRSLLRFFSLI